MIYAYVCGSALRQRGIAAIEFGLVCVVFFMVLFGVVSYGAAFVVQQTLTRAAQEGARAMLQASLIDPATSTAACQAAVNNALSWLNAYRGRMSLEPITACPNVVLQPCAYGTNLTCATVTVTYRNYRTYPLIPTVLPLGTFLTTSQDGLMPQDLRAVATVQMGRS